ncbi:MAG: hypothetical protein JSV44_07915 [Candidatus Zixiibacteriota bacterium]|nr:MAG: hypothetical protein JSV44_07915 [candidate division Zixibacteria bacterium]
MKGKIAYIILLTVLPFSTGWGYAIVDNSVTRDTLSIPFTVLDSAGNAIDLVNGDSVYIVVFYPGGGVAFKDSMAYNDASIKSYDWEDFDGGQNYVYTEKVSTLDGSSPVMGVYGYVLTVDDNTSADLTSTYTGTFQVVNSTLESSLDSASYARKAMDSLHLIIDSLTAVLDSLQSQDDWVGNLRYSAPDSVLRLRGLHLKGTISGDTALVAQGYGTAPGAMIRSGLDGGMGVQVVGYGNYPGMRVECDGAFGTGRGLEIMGGGDGGDGLYLLSEKADGIKIAALDGRDVLATFDSANFSDLTFLPRLFSESYFDSAQGSASGLAAGDIWSYSSREITGGWVDSNKNEQGGSGDSTSIARWIWNTPQGNHVVSGTFGDYLDTEVSRVSAGTGLYSRTVTVVDSSVDQVIPGVRISVRTLDQSSLIAFDIGDAQGISTFNLDSGAALLVPFAPGYLFDSFDTIFIGGAGTDTVYGCSFDPGMPENPLLCRVFGFLLDFMGQPEVDAVISARLPGGVIRYSSGIISPFEKETTTDSAGYFSLDLLPNSCLTPDTSKYEITITLNNGTVLRDRFIVPEQSYWQLTW